MQRKVVTLLLIALVFAPASQAQWITDDEGDTDQKIATVDATYGRDGAADILAVDIQETEDELVFAVAHAEGNSPEIELVDNVYFDLTFNHGEQGYIISVSRVVAADGGVNYYSELQERGNRFSQLGELDAVATDEGFQVAVPKQLIPDQNGARPTQGVTLTDFVVYSTTQTYGNICVGQCISMGPRATDRAPEEGNAATYDVQFGLAQDGDIRLYSDAPVRWSNGEATTFVFEVLVANQGSEKDTVTLVASDIPVGWQVADLDQVELQPGEQRAVPVPVRVPFAHEHGGDPRFLLEAIGISGTGRIELGVHYPAIPQPTGHHSILTIHTRAQDVFIFEELLYNALGGGMGEVAYMNTDSNDDGDEDVRVMGSKSTIGGELDSALDGEVPDYGVIYSWAIPLSPGLRMGLQTDADNITEGSVDLEFDVPVGDVKVSGRIAAVDEDELPERFIDMDSTMGETVAVVQGGEAEAVSGSVTMPFTIDAEATTIPYAPGQALVFFLDAHVIRPDFVLSPNTGVYLTEGELVLPLKEYHDAVSVNVTFPEEVKEQAIQSLDSTPPAVETQDAPSIGGLSLLAAIGLAAWGRRIRN